MKKTKWITAAVRMYRDPGLPETEMKMTDLLCHAIIIQAVKDFRVAYRNLLRRPDNRQASATVKEITRFFCSGYFSLLTELDGPTLLRRLIEEERGADHECA